MNKDEKLEAMNKKIDEMIEARRNGEYPEKIQSVDITTNWVFYESEEYEEREGYIIITESGNKFFLNIPKTASGSSNLLKFAKKYGSVPKPGQKITIDCTGQYDRILI